MTQQSMKLAPRWLEAILKWRGMGAITLPPFGIYARPYYILSERLQRHENAHWQQYKRMGALKFYAKYLWLSARYGYWNNPMEVEARAAEVISGH